MKIIVFLLLHFGFFVGSFAGYSFVGSFVVDCSSDCSFVYCSYPLPKPSSYLLSDSINSIAFILVFIQEILKFMLDFPLLK